MFASVADAATSPRFGGTTVKGRDTIASAGLALKSVAVDFLGVTDDKVSVTPRFPGVMKGNAFITLGSRGVTKGRVSITLWCSSVTNESPFVTLANLGVINRTLFITFEKLFEVLERVDTAFMQYYATPPSTGAWNPVKSNAQRQREFRARNPGYHKRYYISAKTRREQYAAMLRQREADRIANDPQLLLFPGERPAIAA